MYTHYPMNAQTPYMQQSELCRIVKKQLILQSTDYDIGCINSMQK